MTKIKTEIAYNAIIERIKELNSLVNDDTPITHKNAIELDLLISLVIEYEKDHFSTKHQHEKKTKQPTKKEEIIHTYMQLGELCHLFSVELDNVISTPDEIEVAQMFSSRFESFSDQIKKTQEIDTDNIKYILDRISYTYVEMWKGYDVPCHPFYCGFLEMCCDEISKVSSKLRKLLETRIK